MKKQLYVNFIVLVEHRYIARNLNERIISLSALNPITLKDMSQVVDEVQREREELHELKEKLEERECTIAAMECMQLHHFVGR